jgi:WD40 repeat protein
VPAAPFWDTAGGQRLLQRYIGHCNCATDIKEAAFLGQHDDLVACGSDDGRVFIYSSVRGHHGTLLLLHNKLDGKYDMLCHICASSRASQSSPG